MYVVSVRGVRLDVRLGVSRVYLASYATMIRIIRTVRTSTVSINVLYIEGHRDIRENGWRTLGTRQRDY